MQETASTAMVKKPCPNVLSRNHFLGREIATRHTYMDKFEVVFHYGKEEALEDEIKNEIVHLYWDVYHKNGKPYLYDNKRNR